MISFVTEGMRELFWSYYSQSAEQTDAVWSEATVVLDTNVLLNLYRYRPDTRRQLLEILRSIGDRLWIPHHVAAEYQERRIGVISDMRKPYSDLTKVVGEKRDELLDAVTGIPLRLHPVIEIDDLGRVVKDAFSTITDYLSNKEAELPELLGTDLLTADEIRDELDALLQGRIGSPYDEERLASIYTLGAKRYDANVPPGFGDRGKPEPGRYGDLVIWLQIVDHARETGRAVLFVTDDQKDDWWWIARGQKLGPRRELAEELREQAGVNLAFYTPDRFMSAARERLGASISDDALEEVEQASQVVPEAVACPHCGHAPVPFQIGRSVGSSAIPRCPNCASRFHAHRRGNGEVITTKGALGRRVIAACPECASQVPVDFADGDGTKDRVCLTCFASLGIGADGSVDVLGYAQVVDSETTDNRHIRCPRCEGPHGTFASRDGQTFAVCTRADPTIILRALAGTSHSSSAPDLDGS